MHSTEVMILDNQKKKGYEYAADAKFSQDHIFITIEYKLLREFRQGVADA